MSNQKTIQDFVFVSKYARTKENGQKETWEESVNRVMDMHWEKLYPIAKDKEMFQEHFNFARKYYIEKKVIGAQRALQYGGEQLKKHNFRMYNCSSSYADRIEFFSEIFYILLCGAGAGYSVQKRHVSKLPELRGQGKRKTEYKIGDNIEGWSDSMNYLIRSHFEYLPKPVFDFSLIRPKGSHISGGFKAPGPKPLEKALNQVDHILSKATGRKLTPFEVHRISCVIADAVVSGGVRRSALISLFDHDDYEMANCKTGDWFIKYPELARANNSAVIHPKVIKKDFNKLFYMMKEYGEPGLIISENPDFTYNPCAEVGMYPSTWDEDFNKLESGWSTCNLTEINGSLTTNKKEFINQAIAASILGTFQAAYTDFKFLSSATKEIVERDALIGVGITGMCENPDILFDQNIQLDASDKVVEYNKKVAENLGINPAARTTVIKPSGNSSQMLGTSSGIHPFHFQKYIRNIQITDDEDAGKIFSEKNPSSVENSVWGDGKVISFPIVNKEGVLTYENLGTLQFLKLIKRTQDHWIKNGRNVDHPSYKNPNMRGLEHNVSNTVKVKKGEWDDVRNFIWENRSSFCGISLIPDTGDLEYNQAPYTSYLDEKELVEEYGVGALLGSGLNVDGIDTFGNLWTAIDTALGKGENISFNQDVIIQHIKDRLGSQENDFQFKETIDGVIVTDINAIIANIKDQYEKKKDWVRRFNQFSLKYMGGDSKKTANCLKHLSIFHKWQQIKCQESPDYSQYQWEFFRDAASMTAENCYGGACEI